MAAAHALRHRLEIDFRLAGAGDAVEQRHRIAALGDCGAQRIRRGKLAEGEFGLGEIGIGRLRHRFGRQHHRFQRALVDQPVDHAGRHARLARGVALAAGKPVAHERHHARARHGHALRLGACKAHADALAAGTQMLAHAQRHAQHRAARGERIVRHPVDEAAQFGLERRHVELAVDVFQPVVQARIGVGVLRPDNSKAFARAQRHHDHVARRHVDARRNPIGIGLIERHRHQDIDDTAGHI